MDKEDYVILDIDDPAQPPVKCCRGSPKMTKVLLSRNGSTGYTERWASDKQEAEEEARKMVVKVSPSQLGSLRHFLLTNRSAMPLQSLESSLALVSSKEGHKRFGTRWHAIHPSNVLLIFATMACMGTMILLYFTLAAGESSGG